MSKYSQQGWDIIYPPYKIVNGQPVEIKEGEI